jgi:LysR family transcriptional regulator, low CO2-responsive transcriptional regulator
MHYTLHQIQVFLKVTEKLSITKAAEALCLSQPAVSIQLKNFQDQFEIPLTEVVGRKLYVTDFGKEIALAAEKIMNEVHAINYKSLAYKGQLVGNLKISVVSTGKYVMPYFLSGFLHEHEGVDLIMDVVNRTQVIKSLGKNEVDFALVSVLPEKLLIEKVELMQNILYLVGNENRNIAHENNKLRNLIKIPLIFREKGSATRHVMEKYFNENNYGIKRKMELTSNEAVKQAVIAGLGFSIMPVIGIKDELTNGTLKIIPVEGMPLRTYWNLIWLKNKRLSPVAESYLKFLIREKDRIICEKFDISQIEP